MKITAISDLHHVFAAYDNRQADDVVIPPSDVLICAGDMGFWYSRQVKIFNKWLKTLPVKHTIVIAGNHDRYCSTGGNKTKKYLTEAIYLENSGCEIEGIKFWGSPYTPPFMDWFFMAGANERQFYWDKIPKDTNVLITHGPPYKILDMVPVGINPWVGDSLLNNKITELKELKAHIFGHIHCDYGQLVKDGVTYVNASLCNETYNLVNKPITIEI
jgi:Icc-related predicted phosphoesterase